MNTSSTLPGSGIVPLRSDASVIGLVGLAHLISHFSQLLLAPLFPWLKDEFSVSYAELGFLMTIFFVVSCAVQALSGFWVDRFGPRPILFAGLSLLGIAAFGYSVSTSYWMMAGFAVLAGVGNGVFHPVDYTLLNRKVSAPRLGHAYSVHGITGSLGWALAPALVVTLTFAYSWRVALAAAGVLAFAVLAVLVLHRDKLTIRIAPPVKGAPAADSSLGFLKIPAVWMCFAFFFWYAIVLSVVQAFAPEAARQLHNVPLGLVAMCLTIYMVCSAGGMVLGGFLASDPARCERIVGAGFGLAAVVALLLALGSYPAWVVPVLFGAMGFASGIAGPSRDLLVKRSTPDNASGRVYGVVYAGLDIGQAVSPLIFGVMMDHGQFRGVLLGLALMQGVLIASAFNVRRVRRTALVAA
ncbi:MULTISPECIES: MFS transporter [unclassified Polaromonas]|uniref:MFS transporter n=1 Tax=unclassified Polaromonas TaxID=2638319 RepID=UPI000BC93695|nr:MULTISPECIES: MFS transporter [unclassified Polaromonas]OYY35084.1 MAG: MFS transporter [Polaromonas sp. 35-63-35]OYZ20223.1 MAG: MFS transporter [Polaromonas sp. 16-63-31]OYZ77978.1 MAG: MFS transporter [Polaromonas sp. 24-63-21]OZA49488.1 MAG: MFS transporter [Polaromonas sp. 17-63-33]OZA87380.1 MAG: MFS transporter [Polaromonas sp. 39-63-25]